MRKAIACLLLLLLLTGSAGQAQEAVRSCAALASTVAETPVEDNGDAFAGLWEEVTAAESDCDDLERHCIGNRIALAYLGLAYEREAEGASDDEIETVLDRAADYGMPWQLAAAQGDFVFAHAVEHHDASAFSRAGTAYQSVFVQLGDEDICAGFGLAGQPAPEEIAPLYGRMTVAALLAEPLVLPETRCGRCDWLALWGVDGFVPDERALPITFEEASTAFTPGGAQAAEALLSCLKTGGPAHIGLAAHADPRGEEAFNLELSRQRAEALKAYLADGGYRGAVDVVPAGEGRPFPYGFAGLSDEETWRLERRITLTTPLEGALSC